MIYLYILLSILINMPIIIISIHDCDDNSISVSGFSLSANCYTLRDESYDCNCTDYLVADDCDTCWRQIWRTLSIDLKSVLRFNNMTKCNSPLPLEVSDSPNLQSYCSSCQNSGNTLYCYCNYVTFENVSSPQWNTRSLDFLKSCGDRICKK